MTHSMPTRAGADLHDVSLREIRIVGVIPQLGGRPV